MYASGNTQHYPRGAVPGIRTFFQASMLWALSFLGVGLPATPVMAELVELDAQNNIILEANYVPGEPSKPLILFIHGFLQTRDFSTVSRLANALSESGFSTLAPNLSLGISRRKRSVSCESIHLHSLNDSVREIHQWVNWARKQGHDKIVLLGHSTGSIIITAYLADHNPPAVNSTILISLDYFGPGRPAAFETELHAVVARNMLESGETNLATFALSYCKQYITTARNFLSYFDWGSQRVLQAVQDSHSRNHIIFGSDDKRISTGWMRDLQMQHAFVHSIEGANHFFDQSHEFELLDTVESILDSD